MVYSRLQSPGAEAVADGGTQARKKGIELTATLQSDGSVVNTPAALETQSSIPHDAVTAFSLLVSDTKGRGKLS